MKGVWRTWVETEKDEEELIGRKEKNTEVREK